MRGSKSRFRNAVALPRDIKKYAVFFAILFLCSIAIGYYAAKLDPERAAALIDELLATLGPFVKASPIELFFLILINNASKIFLVVLLGVFFGIAPFIFVFANGIMLGVLANVIAIEQGLVFYFLGIVPHGVIEIPALLIASAYGLQLGKRFYKKIRYKSPMKPALRGALSKYFTLILPLLVVASFIETYITAAILEQI